MLKHMKVLILLFAVLALTIHCSSDGINNRSLYLNKSKISQNSSSIANRNEEVKNYLTHLPSVEATRVDHPMSIKVPVVPQYPQVDSQEVTPEKMPFVLRSELENTTSKTNKPEATKLIKYDVLSGVQETIDVQALSNVNNSLNQLRMSGSSSSMNVENRETSETDNSSYPALGVLYKVDNPQEYPWIKYGTYGGCSAALIDSKFILTAGHCVYNTEDNEFLVRQFIPGAEDYWSSLGRINPQVIYVFNTYAEASRYTPDDDMGFVLLSRPIGGLTGWNGYAALSCDDMLSIIFLGTGYPGGQPYEMKSMFYWYHQFYEEVFYSDCSSVHTMCDTYGGMSGAPSYFDSDSHRYVSAVISGSIYDPEDEDEDNHSDNFYSTVITSGKFQTISSVIASHTSADFDIVPLHVTTTPSIITDFDQPISTVSYVVFNDSRGWKSGRFYAQMYLSNDETIDSADTILNTHYFDWNFQPHSGVKVNINNVHLPGSLSQGLHYWIGVVIDEADAHPENNITIFDDNYELGSAGALEPPENVFLPASSNTGKFTLSWSESPEGDMVTLYLVHEILWDEDKKEIISDDSYFVNGLSLNAVVSISGIYDYYVHSCTSIGCGERYRDGSITVSLSSPLIPMIKAATEVFLNYNYFVDWLMPFASPAASQYHLIEGTPDLEQDGMHCRKEHSYTTSNTSMTFDARIARDYCYQVQACNGEGCSSYSEVIVVSVVAPNPVSYAGADQFVYKNTSVTLDGSKSYDQSGRELSFTWQQIEGPLQIKINDNHSKTMMFTAPSVEGTYSFRLTVATQDGYSDYDDVDIIVMGANPVARAGEDQKVEPYVWVQLNGSNSIHPLGYELSYSWNLINGPQSIEISYEHDSPFAYFYSPNQSGSYEIELQVCDQGGSCDVDRVIVEVLSSHPISNAGQDQAVITYQTVYLDGTKSFDPDGKELSFEWILLKGQTTVTIKNAHTSQPSFIAPELEGSYLFELTVSTQDGQSSKDQVVIIVSNPKPVANAGVDQSTYPGTTVILDGSKSYHEDDRYEIAYQWTLRGGPREITIENAYSAFASFVAPLTTGTYEFLLEVSDQGGNLDSDSVTITVNAKKYPIVFYEDINQEIFRK